MFSNLGCFRKREGVVVRIEGLFMEGGEEEVGEGRELGRV